MDSASTDALLRLALAPGAAAPRRRLLDAHASPDAALAAGPPTWRSHGLDDAMVAALDRPDAATMARCHDWLGRPGHQLIGWQDPDYPPLLRRVSSPPLALFIAGDPARLWHPAVAVVGSRAATAGGRDDAHEFARALAASGLGVVSGLAAGIDTAAHEGALSAGGLTIAVLGTGPDVPYPRRNASLLARIAEHGVAISEHPPGTGPQTAHFPSRNRIIAGLALGTLVVEAAERSGGLITARQAAEAGREVFALPGSIHNPMARGCHRLIRDGAALVQEPREVAAALAPLAGELACALRDRLARPETDASPGRGLTQRSAWPDHDYERLWQALDHGPTGMDRLVSRTGLTAAEVSSMLLVMELEGRVFAEHGCYSRGRTRNAS